MQSVDDDGAAGATLERYALEGDSTTPIVASMFRDRQNLTFSYSGLKAAVRRRVEMLPHELSEKEKMDFAAGFQQAAFDQLLDRMHHALNRCRRRSLPIRQFVVCGGVASNQTLVKRIRRELEPFVDVVVPPRHLCQDNGIMIAYAGLLKYQMGHRASSRIGFSDQWKL